MPRRTVAMTPSVPPMIRFVMKPAMAPRTIHAMMPIAAFPPLGCGQGTRGESAAQGEPQRVRVMRSVSAAQGQSDDVLDVAQALLGAALDLLGFTLVFLFPVAGQLTDTFLDLALGLVDITFGVLIGHLDTPLE